MSKTLAGTLFVYNGKSQDYCYLESIKCLKEFCDAVFICDAGSTDGTLEDLIPLADDNTFVISCDPEEWATEKGKEKLNYFTNKAIKMAREFGYDYQFNLQADEIVHERSYKFIRDAIESGDEGFHCRRINLWGSPFTKLNVPQERLPCSEIILRLAKTKYISYGDGESIMTPSVRTDLIEQIRIYHMGFVRDKKIHPQKIYHMEKDVFLVTPDPKLEGMTEFDPWKWFDPSDVVPITESLPLIIQKWAVDRL